VAVRGVEAAYDQSTGDNKDSDGDGDRRGPRDLGMTMHVAPVPERFVPISLWATD
jgi:hypothetical protein